jgi:hypothetical protein
MYDVIEAKYVNDYILEITFENNIKGEIDFSSYLSKQGLFQQLNNIDYFKNFKINKDIGTICWENGLDISPDTLYNKIIG